MLGYLKNEESSSYDLTIDNIPINKDKYSMATQYKTARALLNSVNKPFFGLDIFDADIAQHIMSLSFDDIPDNFYIIHLNGITHHISDMEVRFSITNKKAGFKLISTMVFDIHNWKKPWSLHELYDEMRSVMNLEAIEDPEPFREIIDATFSLYYNIKNPSITTSTRISQVKSRLQSVYNAAVSSLTAKLRTDAMVTLFDFPEAVKVPCQQYLLYFVQFLKDVGVDATAELEEHAGRVLFAVTPKDENVALGKIREALDVYLRLPTNPNVEMVPYGTGVAEQRLSAEIHHLKGQLMLIGATLQQKDMLIQQQQTFIDQQLLGGQVLISSIHQPTQATPTDEEPLIKDIVKVKPYETHGVEVNLPNLLRRLKAWFAETDEENRSEEP